MNFDVECVEPFLRRIAPLFRSGFGDTEIHQIIALANQAEPDEEREIVFKIDYNGNLSEFRVRIFMDDVSAPDMYFFSIPEIAEKIDTEMQRFAEELGI